MRFSFFLAVIPGLC